MAQKVRDVMTGSPVTVAPDTDLRSVARLMRDNGIGDVLVTDDGGLRGVITDRDVVVRAIAQDKDPQRTPVAEVYSASVTSVTPDDDLAKAVQIMREKSVRRLPVVDGGRPVGVVSIGDLALERDERSALADISAAHPNN